MPKLAVLDHAKRWRAGLRTPGAAAALGFIALTAAALAWTARGPAAGAPFPGARPLASAAGPGARPPAAVPSAGGRLPGAAAPRADGAPPRSAVPSAAAAAIAAARAAARAAAAAAATAPERAARWAPRPTHADFAGRRAPAAVRRVADWAVATDAGGLPYLIVDKTGARLWAFGPDGRGRGSAPVLLGLARGDASVPGIGERPLAGIRPEERTTPAGRFLAEPGRNLHGEDIVWIDYEAAVSMHRVRATNPRERRLQRLASPTTADNRISYGCINVPPDFYDGVVRPLLAGGRAVVYVLPERRSLGAVFGPMAAPWDTAAATQALRRAVSVR